jgi:endonuclease/exonuclease/phosphatase family metal-dependent hydrolase
MRVVWDRRSRCHSCEGLNDGYARSRRTGYRLIVALLLVLLLPCLAAAAELKLATWNMNWLTDRPAGDRELPADAHPRHPGDVELLHGYATDLDADVIAIQEVDGAGIAARIFTPDKYSIHMSRDRVVQRVGLVVRRGIHYTVNPDVISLNIDPGHHLRSGVDITLDLQPSPLRIMAVHLKTGCFDQKLDDSRRRNCVELQQQVAPLVDWIAARRAEGVAFAVIGDFNRHMNAKDQFWSAMAQTAPLVRTDEGHSSPCWGGEQFIDHIILGGAARGWLQPDSLRVLTYRETGEEWKDRLSDHCPMSVRLRVPD